MPDIDKILRQFVVGVQSMQMSVQSMQMSVQSMQMSDTIALKISNAFNYICYITIVVH